MLPQAMPLPDCKKVAKQKAVFTAPLGGSVGRAAAAQKIIVCWADGKVLFFVPLCAGGYLHIMFIIGPDV